MTSELFDPLFGMTAVAAATDDQAVLDALCQTEAALARACARVGLFDDASAGRIAAACDELRHFDLADLGRRSVAGGNQVIPLVALLRERVGAETAGHVHLGATSQDILDTALMLVSRRAIELIGTELRRGVDRVSDLAREHRATPMVGRTLLQQAVPTTFGALAAVWGGGLDRTATRLAAAGAQLPVQLGGAAGTLAPLHPWGLAVLTAFAADLGLSEPDGVWHTDRTPITELAGALGTVGNAIGSIATDIVLLAQSELGELSEGEPGGSSAMAHKQNPIAAVTARAAAAQAPGLVATLLAVQPELQRGAGPWHAEWPALLGLLRAVGGAAARLNASLSGLTVHADAMAGNLASLEGTVDVTDLGHAVDLVDRYLARKAS